MNLAVILNEHTEAIERYSPFGGRAVISEARVRTGSGALSRAGSLWVDVNRTTNCEEVFMFTTFTHDL